MVDKGFLIEKECAAKNIKLYIPHKRKKNQQFTVEEVAENVGVASARVHVERKIERIKQFKVFSEKIDPLAAEHVDDLFIIACSITNLSAPILRDHHFL